MSLRKRLTSTPAILFGWIPGVTATTLATTVATGSYCWIKQHDHTNPGLKILGSVVAGTAILKTSAPYFVSYGLRRYLC